MRMLFAAAWTLLPLILVLALILLALAWKRISPPATPPDTAYEPDQPYRRYEDFAQ